MHRRALTVHALDQAVTDSYTDTLLATGPKDVYRDEDIYYNSNTPTFRVSINIIAKEPEQAEDLVQQYSLELEDYDLDSSIADYLQDVTDQLNNQLAAQLDVASELAPQCGNYSFIYSRGAIRTMFSSHGSGQLECLGQHFSGEKVARSSQRRNSMTRRELKRRIAAARKRGMAKKIAKRQPRRRLTTPKAARTRTKQAKLESRVRSIRRMLRKAEMELKQLAEPKRRMPKKAKSALPSLRERLEARRALRERKAEPMKRRLTPRKAKASKRMNKDDYRIVRLKTGEKILVKRVDEK